MLLDGGQPRVEPSCRGRNSHRRACLPDGSIVEELSSAAARLLSAAQAGDADRAAVEASTWLARDLEPSLARAAMEYALAVAHLTRNDLPAAEDAAAACLVTALSVGSAEWQANALAVRAYARILKTHVDQAITDLVDAEVALLRCSDVPLWGSAHTGVGNCFAELRMYELALPHMQRALEIRDPPSPDEVGSFVGLVNLAETELRWAEELERLGLDEPGQVAEHADHVAAATRWVAQMLARAGWRESTWEPVIRRLDAEVQSYRDPAGAIARLRELRTSFPAESWRDHYLLSTAALARALRATGQPAQALAVAREGTAALVPDLEWALAMAVHHQEHLAEVELEVPGARSAATYLRVVLRSDWAQRVRAVRGASGLLQQARLRLELTESSRMAREDALTGLSNRRGYDEAIEASWGRDLGVILIDLDRFKVVNDTFGHAVGDALLVRVAGILRGSARRGDLLARFGGDEMVALVHGAPATVAVVGRRIATALAAISCGDLAVGLVASASVGWTSFVAGDTSRSLLERADQRMYLAKRSTSSPG
ncbi:MAG: diguanylate cyclase [Rhodoglobus sp.]